MGVVSMPAAELCDLYDAEVRRYKDASSSADANTACAKMATIRGLIEGWVEKCMKSIRILAISDDVAVLAYVESWLRRRGGWS